MHRFIACGLSDGDQNALAILSFEFSIERTEKEGGKEDAGQSAVIQSFAEFKGVDPWAACDFEWQSVSDADAYDAKLSKNPRDRVV